MYFQICNQEVKRCRLSSNAVLYVLRRIGFSNEEMTAHGFRGMASTRLRNSGIICFSKHASKNSECIISLY